MLYFDNLPIINYEFIDSNQMVKMRNIFFRLKLTELNKNFIHVYRIVDHPRLDNISFDLYGTTDYWWIIALLNDIKDITFDLPLDEEILQKIATDRAVAEYGSILAPGALAYRLNQVEELIAENDAKRLIKVINKQHIGKVITQILKSL